MAPLDINETPAVGTADVEKPVVQVDTETAREREGIDEKAVHENDTALKQEGVQQVEAITQVWSKRTVIIMFIL
jgi:hypothetical protein